MFYYFPTLVSTPYSIRIESVATFTKLVAHRSHKLLEETHVLSSSIQHPISSVHH
jgi:hypothetical protein